MIDVESSFSGRHRAVLEQLGSAEPTTTQEAAAILDRIRVTKGYLDDETRGDLAALPSGTHHLMMQFVERQRETEAAFTKSISEQLYSSKYRFLYELIQNADDSLYSEAIRTSKLPFLRFTITRETFIVETNEDGFKRANVEAVCVTGKSSKKASSTDDHIGEKGFGFKSVFSVAEEVQIQSGIWSFQFQHRQGDDGLGMVTPLDAEAIILPADVTTRITIHLAKTTDADYQRLLNAVASMPATTVFFLQRLRRFQVHATDLDTKLTATTFEKTALDTPMTRIQLRRHHESGDQTTVDESLYRCFTHVMKNMPENQYRKGRKSTRIELAFPVEPATQQPKLSPIGQHVFAYLPLQRLQQIQFLIQSDFVTSANRESVIDNEWNASIFKGVGKAFATAVESFTKDDDPLRYSWLDYLPTELSDDRWKMLCPSIVEELARRPVLQTWQQRRFKQPKEILLLPKHMLYDDEPILDDLSDDAYLAPNYDVSKYLSKLGSLGVCFAGLHNMIKRLEADLLDLHKSKLRTTDPRDPWHTTFASMFLTAWTTTSPNVPIQERLKRLAIIPLQNRQQWAGAPSQSGGGGLNHIYLSEVDGISIPNSIGLHLLDTHASSDPTRKSFYMALGVEACPHELVVDNIKQIHHQAIPPPTGIPSHFRYLFCANVNPSQIKEWVWVPTKRKHVRDSTIVYFPSEDEHHLQKLLTGIHSSKYRNFAAFLDKSLVRLEIEPVNDQKLQWKDWLRLTTGARYYPPLLNCNDETSPVTLSPALEVIHSYKPSMFLSTLKAHWRDYEDDAFLIAEDLRVRKVRCISIEGQPLQDESLQNTYLPTEPIIDRVLKLGQSPTKFPILLLSGFIRTTDKLDPAGYKTWRFLEDFGVRCQPDLDFYKRALQNIRLVAEDPDFELLKVVYVSMAELATPLDHDDLYEFFSQDLLWIPSSRSWVDRSRCNWCGPAFLRYKTVLNPHYGDVPVLSRFFSGTLDVKDTTTIDVMLELKNRREAPESITSLAVAGEIYAYLCDNTTREKDWQILRDVFGVRDYILGTNNTWHTLETCLWHTPFLLSGYQDLSSTYPQLESFFVKHLKVKKVTSSMLIKEISKMVAKKAPNYVDIRKRLIDVGMVLAKTKLDKATKDALSELAESKFLPIKLASGITTLLGRHDIYAIVDHDRYGSAFAGHDILLEFSVEEVQIMNIMFEHIGVKRHYLSSLVVEESTVEDGAEEDDDLTQQLQVKAYALYCCAAKYKSVKALRGDLTLFETLSAVRVFKCDLATNLVIDNEDLGLKFKVRSDRSFIHHERAEGSLKIYVPEGPKQRQTCYRSQLPKLLADVMCIDSGACHDISVIIGNAPKVLDEILVEHDIPFVSWIEKPVYEIPDEEEEGEDSAPSSPRFEHTQDATYAGMRRGTSSIPVTAYPQDNRSSHQRGIDRHNGALSEAFVFETLSSLIPTGFTLDNWQSTIRGELSRYPQYAGITNWLGCETADFVYTDRDGILTEWLKRNCTGDYPDGTENRDFAEHPIEYYLEVKSTTGSCESPFFLSSAQYKLMHDMAVQTGQEPTRMYVIMRVFDVKSQNKGLEVFVDPIRLEGEYLEFVADGWTGRRL